MSDIVGFTEANRRTWDERAAVHRADRTGFYGVEECRKGGDSLGPIEAAEIGDVAGKRLLHLQCHFGLDTLSLARRGAIATGVDFSAPAIAAARDLAAESGLAARFVQSDVYETRAALLRAAGQKQLEKHLAAQVGRMLEIVVEQDGLSGHSETFAPVKLAAAMPVGSLQRVTIHRADQQLVYAA